MIDNEQIIRCFSGLGLEFKNASGQMGSLGDNKPPSPSVLTGVIENSLTNPWFIPSFVRFAFNAWAEALQEEKVRKWLHKYQAGVHKKENPASVGIVMAGNIPMVGLHDLLCVLASGHRAIIRLSESDNQLIPAILNIIYSLIPEIKNKVSIASGPLKNFDAIIATGSNNAARYFDYYFARYPTILRRNRNGVAVITGNETESDMVRLSDDIFVYFGLGCRNVSKLYLPDGFKVQEILPFFNDYAYLSDFHKYRNNYDYQKSILLINRIHHLDNGFLLVKEDTSLISPISVIHAETYNSTESLNRHLFDIREQIQCIVSAGKEIDSAIPPGQSQYPELWDYADGVDTMEFLMTLQ